MIPFTEIFQHNDSFSGKIPGWGTGGLVSLMSALVVSNRTINSQVAGAVGVQNITYQEYQLKSGTLVERTKFVDKHGFIKLRLAEAPQGSHYRLFAFFERLSNHKNLEFKSSKHTSIFDNGSYTVDHFSTHGAAVIKRFWEHHILKDGLPELISRVGNYAWEDSLEITFNMTWSRSLPDRFKRTTGYSIKPYLPLMTFQQNNLAIQPTEPGSFKCVLDTEDQGIGYVNDFRATLVQGYKQYLTAMAAWTNEVLGVQLSAQPAYGLNMDMLAAIPVVDAPECESLSFQDNIDSYRAFTGPARLTGKRVVSNEMAAVRGGGFRYHLPQLIFSVNRAFLGGVNQNVLHGQTYSGNYFNTTWPGYIPFRYLFSDPWSATMPIWNHGLKGTIEYMARMQHVLQGSVAKADLVMYNKESATTIRTIYGARDLVSEGWSWNYVTAENLRLEQAHVKNGALAPDGPQWKAFILEASQNVTIDTIESLQKFAQNGLPIIISGGKPRYHASRDASAMAKVEQRLENLMQTQNVHSVATGKVAEKLKSLGLSPKVGVTSNRTCYTSWSEADGISYAIVYADLKASRGDVTVATTQTPYYLNPWTGETYPVLVYKRTENTTIIPFSLAGNQTVLIAFGSKLQETIPVPGYHIEKIPSNVIGSRYTRDDGVILHVARSTASTKVVLSNSTHLEFDASSVPPAFQLSKWDLTAEHWEAPNDLYESNHTVKYNTTHSLQSPTSWSDIPALDNASGVGYYTTTFQWPPKGTHLDERSLGAYLSFSKVVDSVTVVVNGHRIPAMDITNAIADISTYLKNGQNSLHVVVPTTMWNYIRNILADLVTAGSRPLPITLQEFGIQLEPRSEAGLVGRVSITPYRPMIL